MDEVLRQVHALEQRPGILSVTISTGFPWSDIENMGASVIVNANGDQALADRTADELVKWIWDRRERWHRSPVSVSDALAQGEAIGKYPIILADQADNTGGGAGGDSTEILQTFLDRRMRDSLLLYIVDPAVAKAAHSAGVGATLDIDVGGKSDPVQGPPVRMHAKVRGISNGAFKYDGPMFAGLTGNMGCSTWLEQDGVNVVVVTAAEQPLGPAFAKTLGIDCRSMRVIAVKSAVHFRASFEPIAGSIFNVDTKAVHTHDFTKLKYHRRRRPMYPLDGR
jgi:microcystin degradation protein MlrC